MEFVGASTGFGVWGLCVEGKSGGDLTLCTAV